MFAPRDVVGQRSETVRRSNLSAIVRAVHLRGPLSRSELVAAHRPDAFGDPRADRRARRRRAADGDAQRPGRSARAARRRSSIPTPTGRRSSRSRSTSTRSRPPASGLGGTIDELVRVDRPRAHVTRGRDRHRRRRPRRAVARLGAGRRAGRHRRGRRRGRPQERRPRQARSEPGVDRRAARRLASRPRFEPDAPIAIANEADLGGLAEHRRGAAMRCGERRLRGGRGRRGRPRHGGRRAPGRRRRLRRRGRAHDRQPRRDGVRLRLVRLLGDRDR